MRGRPLSPIRRPYLFAAALLLPLLSGCAPVRNGVPASPEAPAAAQPAQPSQLGQVVLMFPGRATTPASLYDGTTYVGNLARRDKLVTEVEPGLHRFMVQSSENADFIDVEVEAGRTYYVEVSGYTGVWSARFKLGALDPTLPNNDIEESAARCKHVVPPPGTIKWAQNRQKKMEKLKTAYEAKWEASPTRQSLRANQSLPQ